MKRSKVFTTACIHFVCSPIHPGSLPIFWITSQKDRKERKSIWSIERSLEFSDIIQLHLKHHSQLDRNIANYTSIPKRIHFHYLLSIPGVGSQLIENILGVSSTVWRSSEGCFDLKSKWRFPLKLLHRAWCPFIPRATIMLLSLLGILTPPWCSSILAKAESWMLRGDL